MTSVLGSLGAEIEFSDNEVVVKTDGVGSVEPDPTRIGKFRGGFFVIGPLLARFGEAVVGLPGGCDIGARPVDIYVSGLRALGAVVEVRDNKVVAQTANGNTWLGALTKVSVQEPEIIDLARFLTKSGAHLEGVGTDKIVIYGKSRLLGAEYGIMPDRIETGSFMLAAAITRSCISLSPVFPGWLSSLIDKLVGAGCKITHKHDMLEVSAVPASSVEDLRGFDVRTLPYPGFPTDLQPQTMALLSTCNGLSIVDESVFENRMTHVEELQKLGAKIQVFGSTALIYGKEKGKGGMSIVLAGLAAEGVTEVNGVSHIDRGYENLENKLRLLGADVKRFEFSKSNLQQ
ncbi:hypothetical protein DH2020_031553 [Rehmannia glutinosa]|uniref:UDP-N-acetylglucosamine 1-carboxyvinyltransferase n=1 Tax=Rehmannia glutinosa TaxID=99300 RepID=A0ABR0VHN9_REHGL